MAGPGLRFTRRAALLTLPSLGGLALGYALGRRCPARRRWHVEPRAALEPGGRRDAVAFLVLGDTGHPGALLDSVVGRAREAAALHGLRFGLVVGDLAYPEGVKRDDRAGWERHVSGPLRDGVPDLDWYLALGNHDYDPEALIELAREEPRLILPARHYEFTQRSPDGGLEASFHVLDSSSMRLKYLGADEQVAWLSESLLRSQANWRLLVSHHGMLSGGTNHGSAKTRRKIARPLEAGVDLVLSGHDHDLELLDDGEPWLQVISGAASGPRAVESIAATRFASADPGFALVALRSRSIEVEFWTAERGPVQAFELRPEVAL